MSNRTKSRVRRQKRLDFERLEPRALLAVTFVPTVSGTITGSGSWSYRDTTRGPNWVDQGSFDRTFDIAELAATPTYGNPTFSDGYGGASYHGWVAVPYASGGSTAGAIGTNALVQTYSPIQSGSVTFAAEMSISYFLEGNETTPDGSTVILGMIESGHRQFATDTDVEYENSTFNAVVLEGLSQHAPQALPTRNGDYPITYYKATVGQAFTVRVSFGDSTSSNNQVSAWVNCHLSAGFSLWEASGNLTLAAQWSAGGLFSDAGVDVSYTVYGDLVPAPDIQLVWPASETTPEVVAYQFTGNASGALEGGTTYDFTVPGSALTAPYHLGTLLVRLDPAQPVAYSRTQAHLGFQSEVEVEVLPPSSSWSSSLPRGMAAKNEAYELFVNVTNHSPGGVAIPPIELRLSEYRTQGSAAVKDPNPGLYQSTVTVPSLKGGESRDVSAGTFLHNWEWIPDENPIDSIFESFDALVNWVKDFSTNAVFEFGEIIEKTKGLFKSAGWAAQAFEWGALIGDLYFTSELENRYRYTIDLPSGISGLAVSREVALLVPQSRLSFLRSYIAAKALADFQLGLAVSSLIAGGGTAALPALQLASYKGYLDLARLAYDNAKDPPDPNYTTPVTLEFDAFDAGDVPLIDQDRSWLLREIIAHRRAAAMAVNKADGAELAGNWYWQSFQLKAAAEFSSRASRLEQRLGVLESLYASSTRPITESDVSLFSQRMAADGLPPDVVANLLAAGFSEMEVAALTAGLAQLSSTAFSMAAGNVAASQASAIAGFLSGVEMLLQSVRLEVTKLGAEVLPVADETIAELDADDAIIVTHGDAELADEAHEAAVDGQLTRLQGLIGTTKNVAVLEPYLQRATAARLQLIARSSRTGDVATIIDAAVLAGDADSDAAVAVQQDLEQVAMAFAASAPNTSLVAQAFEQAVAAKRDAGISSALADNLSNWAASVSGKSRLTADSFVLEVGKSYDLDVLANDSAVGGTLVQESLAIIEAGDLRDAVAVINGRLRLQPTAAMAGSRVVSYSVFDDASYLRNTQTASLIVVSSPPGIEISEAAAIRGQNVFFGKHTSGVIHRLFANSDWSLVGGLYGVGSAYSIYLPRSARGPNVPAIPEPEPRSADLLIPVEHSGIALRIDALGRLYADRTMLTQTTTPTPGVMLNAMNGYSPIAIVRENQDSTWRNTLLWQHRMDQSLIEWQFDSDWVFQGNSRTPTEGTDVLELAYQIDINRDGSIGFT